MLVTRFAPSPTGFLHIGGARTALFNWLAARSRGGKFLLRIEDTDRKRSTVEAVEAIFEAMRWLGLDWDEEPVFQSSRADEHNRRIDELVEAGAAYWCECSPEQVDAMREKARAEGRKPKYDGTCREKGLGPGPGRVVRFKTPLAGTTDFVDTVKGPTSWGNQEMDDMILRRSDGAPTYNLAVVVDDHDMGVNLVLRGDDHVANTPKQILLYRALGWDVPAFGHMPLILGPDKKKLSKRHGALSATEYRDMGYLSEAMDNYLARLGWSYGDREIFSREELVECFTPDNLGNSPAVFDTQKLDWVNSHYIKESSPAKLAGLAAPFVEAAGISSPDLEKLAEIVPLYQPRAKTLKEMAEQSLFFLVPGAELEYDQKAVAKFLTPEARGHVADLAGRMDTLDDFTEKPLEELYGAYLEEKGIKFKVIAQPIRVAVTGRTFSPGLFETMAVLGKQETISRLNRAVAL